MVFDKVDKKIIRTLKKEEEANMNRLILKAFARESQSTFKRRLKRLESKNIIIINSKNISCNKCNEYIIKLKNKKQKV